MDTSPLILLAAGGTGGHLFPAEALGVELIRRGFRVRLATDPRALRYLADIVGAERIMMGSDMPFPIGDLAPLKIVAETKFTDAERAAINGGLAQLLFGL